jgi:hypothetical protein
MNAISFMEEDGKAKLLAAGGIGCVSTWRDVQNGISTWSIPFSHAPPVKFAISAAPNRFRLNRHG